MCVLVFKYLKNAFIQNKQAIGGGSEKALLELEVFIVQCDIVKPEDNG